MSDVTAEHLAKIEECADLKIRLEASDKAVLDLRAEIEELRDVISTQLTEITKGQKTIESLRRHIAAIRLSMKTLFDSLAGLEK